MAATIAGTAGQVSAQTWNTLSAAETAKGFQILFDGSLESFNASFVDYHQYDSLNTTLSPAWGLLADSGAVVTGSPTVDVRSLKKYRNFDLRFDYRSPGDAGAYYRFTLDGAYAWNTGLEMSILENTANCNICAGAVFELYEPYPNTYKTFDTGEWNSVRIVAVDDSVEHWMNGRMVLGYKYHSADFWARVDASKWASEIQLTMAMPGNRDGGYIGEGYIGFQADHASLMLRNLRINDQTPALGTDDTWVTAIRPAKAAKRISRRPGPSPHRFTVPLGDGSPATLDGRKTARKKPATGAASRPIRR
jgi:hypothetical protein